MARTTYSPREIDDITSDDNEDIYYGFCALPLRICLIAVTLIGLPETWLDLSRDKPKIKQNYKKAVPYRVIVDVQGNEGHGESVLVHPRKIPLLSVLWSAA